MDIREEARAAIRKVERGGSDENRLWNLAQECIGWGIPLAEIPGLVREHEAAYPFLMSPIKDYQIAEGIAKASEYMRPGQYLELKNFVWRDTVDPKKKKQRVPLTINMILEQLHDVTDGRIAKVDNVLFVDDPELGLHFFNKHKASGLFGFLHSKCNVAWCEGGGFVKQAELFAELERTAKQYNDVETIPHEPPVPGIYYGCAAPKAGSGERLKQLLAFFSPATELDGQLLKLLFLTAFWGGPAGTRPLFVVTSDDGRGAGKTSVFKILAYLVGGMIEVSANADMDGVITRLLSPGGQSKRLMLLDNIKTMKFSWAELEALVTSPTISGKRLYSGEGQRPNLLTIGLTLNGVNLAEDIAQRSVVVKVKRPEYLGNWFEEVYGFVDQFRDEIIGDIIGELRGERIEIDSFTRWGTWEKHVLSLLPEANELRDLIVSRQHESNCDREEAQLIEDMFTEQLNRYSIDPVGSVVRIPNGTVHEWFALATNEHMKTGAVTRKLKQMANEGQLLRLRPDPSRTHGRCWLWVGENSGPNASTDNRLIANVHALAA